MDYDLKGKNIVVTGGSSGIGEAIVRQASERGANILFTYNSGEDRAKIIGTETGSKPVKLELGGDWREFSGNHGFRYLLEEMAGGIDYFIANAGRELSGGMDKHTPEEIFRIVNINLIWNMFLIRELVYGNLMNRGGQITVIGSIAADGNHDQFAYSAAKAGLRGAVESLSRYDSLVKERGLGVKLLEPSFVRTPMTERILKIIERKVIPRKGGDILVQEFKDKKLVMTCEYAAQEVLRLTLDPGVKGVRTIPEGVNFHDLREKYLS